MMRIRATCGHCGREFLFFQLYNASPEVADRCPHCSAHLGILGLGRLAARADHALDSLAQALEQAGGHNPGFRVQPSSVLAPLEEVLGARTDKGQSPEQASPRRLWPSARRAA